MKITVTLTAVVVVCGALAWAGTVVAPQPVGVRLAFVDVHIDPHGKPLAAWQFQFKAAAGNVTIAGLEGGEHPAYREPAYYDPQAIQQQRIIAAAFNTAAPDDLPPNRTRVARVHLLIVGNVEPQYELELTTAATTDGTKIDADISLQQGTPK